jgi:hypothetical protein
MPFAQCSPVPAVLAYPWVLLPERAQVCVQRLLLALLIVAVQTLCVPLALGTPLWQADHMLLKWDAKFYGGIVLNGYHSSIPHEVEPSSLTRTQIEAGTDIAFYPAYPLVVRVLRLLGVAPLITAMLLVSRGAAVVAWAYILAWLTRLRIPAPLQVLCILAIAAHPGAFFLVMPYSESLFLASLLGFAYWTLDRRDASGIAAVLHGVAMTATKFVALPLAALPLVVALWRRCMRSQKGLLTFALWDSALAACGGLGFLLYCQLLFGHWDLYIWRQRLGWGIHPDYLFFLRWPPRLLVPEVQGPLLEPAQLGRFAAAAIGWLFLAIVVADAVRLLTRKDRCDWMPRIALYWCAGWILYISGASFAPMGMESIVRHTFPVFVLLTLLAAPLLMRCRPHPALRATLEVSLATLLMCAVLLQGLLLFRYANWMWVA